MPEPLTDARLTNLEAIADTINPMAVLDLIAEVRRLRAIERAAQAFQAARRRNQEIDPAVWTRMNFAERLALREAPGWAMEDLWRALDPPTDPV